MQLFGTSADAAVALLGWEPLEVMPKGPGGPAGEEFLQLLSLGEPPSADEYNKLMAGARAGLKPRICGRNSDWHAAVESCCQPPGQKPC